MKLQYETGDDGVGPAMSGQSTRAAQARSMRTIPAWVVQKMRNSLSTENREEIMGAFGISKNTWLKIKTGEPIRASVASRLLDRVAPD